MSVTEVPVAVPQEEVLQQQAEAWTKQALLAAVTTVGKMAQVQPVRLSNYWVNLCRS